MLWMVLVAVVATYLIASAVGAWFSARAARRVLHAQHSVLPTNEQERLPAWLGAQTAPPVAT
jgi:hypothetical protein